MDRNGIVLAICFIIELMLGIMIIFSREMLDVFLLPAVIITLVMWIIMLVISVTEVVKSERIGIAEKVLWIIGLVSVFNLAGLVYIFIRRWRVVAINKRI